MDVRGCARCDGDGHPGLQFLPLIRPVEIYEIKLTHWALCPTNGEPILLAALDAVGAAVAGEEAFSAYQPPDVLEGAGMTPQAALRAYGWKGPRDVTDEELGEDLTPALEEGDGAGT